MRFKQIFGTLLLLGFLGFLGYKLIVGMAILNDGWLTALVVILLLIIILFGMRKILSEY